MADDEQKAKEDLQKLVPEDKTVEVNGVEIDVKPLQNEPLLKGMMEASKRDQDNRHFFYQAVASTLNSNEGFSDITIEDIKNSRFNIAPLIEAITEVNGLGDFLDEEEIEEM